MALINCKECGKTVSNNAKFCPNCGIKNPGLIGKGCVFALIVLAGIIWLLSELGGDDQSGNTYTNYKNKTTAIENGADSPSVNQKIEGTRKDNETNFTKKQFIDGWNSISNKKIKSIKYKDKAAQINIENNQILQFYQGSKEDIKSVLLFFASNKPVDIVDFMLNMVAIIAGVQPNLLEAQRGEILSGLRLIGDNAEFDFSDEKGPRKYIVGNVKYWITYIQGIGIVFGAEVSSEAS
jgi:hypothetical protein